MTKQHFRWIGSLVLSMVFAPFANADIIYQLVPHVFQDEFTDDGNFPPTPIPINVELVSGTIRLAFNDLDLPRIVTEADVLDYSITVQVGSNTYSWTKADQSPTAIGIIGNEGINLEATSSALRFIPVDDALKSGSLSFVTASPGPRFNWIASYPFRNYSLAGVQPPPFGFAYADSYNDFRTPNVWTVAVRDAAAVPEPASIAVFGGSALMAVAWAGWRRRKARSSVA